MRALVIAVALVACAPVATPSAMSRTGSPTAAAIAFVAPADARTIDGGCNSTRVWKGTITPELQRAAGNNAPGGLPVAIADPPIAAGFIFGYPLRAGHPQNPSNKILWVVGAARTGDLVIDGAPTGASGPPIHYGLAPNSSPGDIYPSAIDVPQPGCWLFRLTFAGRTATIAFEYGPG